MPAISTKGTRILMQQGGTTGTPLVPTAIADNAGAAEITVANTAKVGDIVKFGTVGFAELDNKTFVVKTATASEFTLAGVDISSSTGSLSASPTATLYAKASLVSLCLSGFDIGQATVNSIDVSTFCNAGSISGQPQLGTLTLNGFVDKTDTGFLELIKAELDGTPRFLQIELPNNLGWLVGEVTVSSISYSVPLEGAVGFTINAAQNQQIKYVMS